MSIMESKPDTPDSLLNLSSVLTRFVSTYDLTPTRDSVVFCAGSETPEWESDPAAWYNLHTHDIVLNIGKACQSIGKRKILTSSGMIADAEFGSSIPDDGSISESIVAEMSRLIERRSQANSRDKYHTFVPDEFSINTIPVIDIHHSLKTALNAPARRTSAADVIACTALAMAIHETGHAVFSRFMGETDGWISELSWYERRILTVFEELRSERQQLKRLGFGASLLRFAADVIVSPKEIEESISKSREDGEISIPSYALNVTLCLGRIHYDVFREDETRSVRNLTKHLLGENRLNEMFDIYKSYSSIRLADEKSMTECVKRWVELFPEPENPHKSIVILSVPPIPGDSSESSGDGEPSDSSSTPSPGGKSETIDLPGLPTEIGEALDKAVTEAEVAPDAIGGSTTPAHKPTPSDAAYKKAVHADQRNSLTSKPTAEDRVLARRLGHELQNIDLSDRVKELRPSDMPPGRLDSRAAVQRQAELAERRIPQSQPFKRVIHSASNHSRLVVGVLTDTSGSHGWAETFNARMTYIIGNAVHQINGRFAGVTYGDQAIITVGPTERPNAITTIRANGSQEEFDLACGALDHMLKLTVPMRGETRILFVIGDGQMVKQYEMKKTADWVQRMRVSGCAIVWITTYTPDHYYDGMPMTPKGATSMIINQQAVKQNPTSAIAEVANHVKKAIRHKTR
jgi:hypothetical protein